MDDFRRQPVTRAVSLALLDMQDPGARSDLLFLEAWELQRPKNLAATLRASQIRRANPGLAAAIEQELKSGAGVRAVSHIATVPRIVTPADRSL